MNLVFEVERADEGLGLGGARLELALEWLRTPVNHMKTFEFSREGPAKGKREGNVHKDTAAEFVLGLLDDAVDDHLFDIKDGEHGRGEDEHDRLRELSAWACTGRALHERVGEACVRMTA